jgi:hypothetical protein
MRMSRPVCEENVPNECQYMPRMIDEQENEDPVVEIPKRK